MRILTIYLRYIIYISYTKPLLVPINPGHNLTKSQSPSDPQAIEEMKRVPYREAVGSLMYVVIGT